MQPSVAQNQINNLVGACPIFPQRQTINCGYKSCLNIKYIFLFIYFYLFVYFNCILKGFPMFLFCFSQRTCTGLQGTYIFQGQLHYVIFIYSLFLILHSDPKVFFAIIRVNIFAAIRENLLIRKVCYFICSKHLNAPSTPFPSTWV